MPGLMRISALARKVLWLGPMSATRDDPAHASVLVAESVVALARAEIRLALSSVRASGVRLASAVAFGATALLFVQAAFVVLVLSPVLWTFRPVPTAVALALSLGLAGSVSLFAWRRFRSLGVRRLAPAPESLVAVDAEETRA